MTWAGRGRQRRWTPESLGVILRIIAELGGPGPGQDTLVIPGAASVERYVLRRHRELYGELPITSFRTAEQILIVVGALQRGYPGRQAPEMTRWVKPAAAITQQQVDGYYAARRARRKS